MAKWTQEGSRNLILFENLYELDRKLTSGYLEEKMRRSWERLYVFRGATFRRSNSSYKARPEGRFSFVLALWRTLRQPYGHVIFPRVCLIGFSFAQPFLITSVLDFLGHADDDMSRNQGYGLIAATGCIYLGIAVC